MQFRLIFTLLTVGCLLLPLGCRSEVASNDSKPAEDAQQPSGAVSTPTPNSAETPQPSPPINEDEPSGGTFGSSFDSAELGSSPQLELPFPQAHEGAPGSAEPLPATRIEPPNLTQPPATSNDLSTPPSSFGGLNPPLTTPGETNPSPPASEGGFQPRSTPSSTNSLPGGPPALLNDSSSSRRTRPNELSEPNPAVEPAAPTEPTPADPGNTRLETANSLQEPAIRPAAPTQPLEPFGPRAETEGYPLRTWSDRAGQFTLTAKFVGAADDSGRVRLERTDGKVFNIDLDDLSERDRGYADAVLNPASFKKLRNWIDSTGKFTFVGRFVARENEFIRLEDTDGKAFRVTLANLSSYDRGFIEGMAL